MNRDEAEPPVAGIANKEHETSPPLERFMSLKRFTLFSLFFLCFPKLNKFNKTDLDSRVKRTQLSTITQSEIDHCD